MNSSSISSLTKMNTNSLIDDSPKEDGKNDLFFINLSNLSI